MRRSGRPRPHPRPRPRLVVPVAIALVLGACAPLPEPPPSTTSSTTTTSPSAGLLAAACAGTLVASTPGSVAADPVTELSGLAASRRTDGILWAHNDSGDSARVFAVGADGSDRGQYTLGGAGAVDWEDVAVGPGPDPGVSYLYVGDVGDNAAARSSVQVYRVAEPPVPTTGGPPAPQTLTGVARLTLTYPDGPHDAEALLVDPISGDLLLVTKALSGAATVFRAPANLADGSTTALTQVAALSLGLGAMVTAADVTPAGDVVALRTYFSVALFPRPAGGSLAAAFAEAPCAGAVASESQGEALAFTADGRAYVTASEGSHPPLHRFAAP
jgi:hypothetical protein